MIPHRADNLGKLSTGPGGREGEVCRGAGRAAYLALVSGEKTLAHNDGVTVRVAGSSDARVVAGMLVAFNAEFDTWTPPLEILERRFASLLERSDVLVLLAEDPAPVGFALLTLRPSPYYDGPVTALDELYVVPQRRGQGVGTELMAALLREALGRDSGEVQINVDEEDRDARRFYEAHGFTNQEPGSAERMLCYLREL